MRDAAAALARFPDYDPYVLERHHRQKKDAPSGTARALARVVEAAGGPARARRIADFEGAIPDDAFHVSAVRAGGIVGEHTVGFDSGATRSCSSIARARGAASRWARSWRRSGSRGRPGCTVRGGPGRSGQAIPSRWPVQPPLMAADLARTPIC